MLEHAFEGFLAIAPPDWKKPWRQVFGIKPDWSGDIAQLYREKARNHPRNHSRPLRKSRPANSAPCCSLDKRRVRASLAATAPNHPRRKRDFYKAPCQKPALYEGRFCFEEVAEKRVKSRRTQLNPSAKNNSAGLTVDTTGVPIRMLSIWIVQNFIILANPVSEESERATFGRGGGLRDVRTRSHARVRHASEVLSTTR